MMNAKNDYYINPIKDDGNDTKNYPKSQIPLGRMKPKKIPGQSPFYKCNFI